MVLRASLYRSLFLLIFLLDLYMHVNLCLSGSMRGRDPKTWDEEPVNGVNYLVPNFDNGKSIVAKTAMILQRLYDEGLPDDPGNNADYAQAVQVLKNVIYPFYPVRPPLALLVKDANDQHHTYGYEARPGILIMMLMDIWVFWFLRLFTERIIVASRHKIHLLTSAPCSSR